jgi:hypothetical protein
MRAVQLRILGEEAYPRSMGWSPVKCGDLGD